MSAWARRHCRISGGIYRRVIYERVGKTLGFAKSTLCKWLRQEEYKRPELSGEVLERDVVWTRVDGGKVELNVARDERGVALASAGS